jgi:hypothetical protein
MRLFRSLGVALIMTAWTIAGMEAQVIRNHPQMSSYDPPAMLPNDSGQCHWEPGNVEAPHVGPVIGHAHFDFPGFPIDGEIAGPFVQKFVITAFHVDGELVAQGESWVWDDDSRPRPTDWFWDETQSSTPPKLIGDPMGVRVWSGHFTIHPGVNVRHGMRVLIGSVTTYFRNGAVIINQHGVRYWAVDDPSAPLFTSLFMQPRSVACAAASAKHPEIGYGAAVVEVRSPLPVAPFSSKWPITFVGYGYTARDLPPAQVRMVADLDLHNGIPGRELASIQQFDGGGPDQPHTFILDPEVLGPGPHKIAIIRSQRNVFDDEEQDSLYVFNVVVDPNAPPVVFPDVGAAPPPPPPPPPPTPPPAKVCSGTVSGTSDGTTMTITGGSIACR